MAFIKSRPILRISGGGKNHSDCILTCQKQAHLSRHLSGGIPTERRIVGTYYNFSFSIHNISPVMSLSRAGVMVNFIFAGFDLYFVDQGIPLIM